MVTVSCGSFKDPLGDGSQSLCLFILGMFVAVGRKVLYVIPGVCEYFRDQVISYFTKFEHQEYDTSLSIISQRFQLDMLTVQH